MFEHHSKLYSLNSGYSVQLVTPLSNSTMQVTTSSLARYNSKVVHVPRSNKACLSVDLLHPQNLSLVMYPKQKVIYSKMYDVTTTLVPFKGEFELSLSGAGELVQVVLYMSEYGMVNGFDLEPGTCSERGMYFQFALSTNH